MIDRRSALAMLAMLAVFAACVLCCSPGGARATSTLDLLEQTCPNGAAIERAIADEGKADPGNRQAWSDSRVRTAEQFDICADDGPAEFVRSVSKMLYLTRMQGSHVTYEQNDVDNPPLYDEAKHLRIHMMNERSRAYTPFIRAIAQLMQSLDADYRIAGRKLHGKVPRDLRFDR